MLRLKLLAVFVILCGTFAQDSSSMSEENSRDISDFSQENWRALEPFSPPPDPTGQPKRRRIRKRKRRPLPWPEMEDISQKPMVRRRLTPVYEDEPVYEKVRDPFSGLLEAEEKQKKSLEEPEVDLKALLKQNSGGLSLSELLQQKNLSLAELLTGNRQAISALKETTTPEPEVETTEKYRRLPPSIGLRKEVDRNYERSEESDEGLTSDEIVEAQRKRLSLLHAGNGKLFTDVTHFDVVTEEVTEKRVFVPTNTRIYPDEVETTTMPTTTTQRTTLRAKVRLPMTSARMLKLGTTPQPIPQPIPIDINEIFGFGLVPKPNSNDEPLRMTIDLQDEIETTTTTSKPISLPEKWRNITAKDEIMEILKNPVDREHLSRILKTRNMTVEQLVEQRERGSSQLHLADIFHNNTREPEPKGEVLGKINDDFAVINRKPKLLPPVPVTRPQEYTITSFPTFKIEMAKKEPPSEFPGYWQEIHHFFPNKNQESEPTRSPSTTTPVSTTTSRVIYEDVVRLEEVDNDLAVAASNRLNFELRPNYDEEETLINLPPGIKSAIVASLAVVGLSLLVFLTILVIFKWTQRQKRKLNYTGSFSGSKIKSPILERDEQKRSFRSIMTETLGRKKNHYYKNHLQSMSDSIWDNNEKKSYMI